MIARHDAAIVPLASSIVGQGATLNAMLDQLRAMVAQHQTVLIPVPGR